MDYMSERCWHCSSVGLKRVIVPRMDAKIAEQRCLEWINAIINNIPGLVHL